MKILLLISLIGYSALFTSCKDENNPARRITELNTADTFLFEFPKRDRIGDSFWYMRKASFEKSLGLQSLEKGFDSIQIRLWYEDFSTGRRLIILSNSNKGWKAEVSTINTDDNPNFKGDEINRANPDFLEEYIVTRTIESKMPKSGWDKFIKKLFNLNILTLPDEGKVTAIDQGSGTDGWSITVEIATKKVYRYYNYSNPDYFYRQAEEARNINHILVFVDEEFGLEPFGEYIDKKPAEVQRKIVTADSFQK
jgi:hypothetical protein